MERIYETADREPLSDQILRVDHWKDSDLYEVSISYVNNAAGVPLRKIAKIFLISTDIEKLAFSLQAHLEDRIRQEAGL